MLPGSSWGSPVTCPAFMRSKASRTDTVAVYCPRPDISEGIPLYGRPDCPLVLEAISALVRDTGDSKLVFFVRAREIDT